MQASLRAGDGAGGADGADSRNALEARPATLDAYKLLPKCRFGRSARRHQSFADGQVISTCVVAAVCIWVVRLRASPFVAYRSQCTGKHIGKRRARLETRMFLPRSQNRLCAKPFRSRMHTASDMVRLWWPGAISSLCVRVFVYVLYVCAYESL